jgi:DNA recombination protein RmuC
MAEILPVLVAVAVIAAFVACAALFFVLARARNRGPGPEALVGDLARLQSEAVARLQGMVASLQQGQSQLQKAVNERLDSVSHRLGDSLQKVTQHTAENLQKLNERLAVIDGAQKNISELATQVTSLQGVLANKQERGAFGQGRMEIIVRDGLPRGCYGFQHTLSNNTRPDCVVHLPGQRPLVIDAKFPLEAVTAFKDAKSEDERRAACARVRSDIAKHVGDIAQKYLIPGETQDIALMFVPSESLYADLQENFDDVVQKAFRAKVVIVSPSLLMVAVHLVSQMQKEERMREAAGQIRAEVGRLIEDVARMHERVLKLQQHFGQANEDVRQIMISAEKVEKRGARIAEVEFDEDNGAADALPSAIAPKLEAGK